MYTKKCSIFHLSPKAWPGSRGSNFNWNRISYFHTRELYRPDTILICIASFQKYISFHSLTSSSLMFGFEQSEKIFETGRSKAIYTIIDK